MPNIPLNSDLVSIPHLRDRLRKLRWFVSAFKVHTSLVEKESGTVFVIDEGRINRAFFDWTDTLAHSREGVEIDLPDFVVFAAGLALTSLVHHDPARPDPAHPVLERTAETLADDTVASIVTAGLRPDRTVWPSGYLYVTFCLSVIAALERQEFGRVLSRVHEEATDPLFWGSLCENVGADSRLAIPYLDRLLGKEPNWEQPERVTARAAMLARRAARPLPRRDAPPRKPSAPS